MKPYYEDNFISIYHGNCLNMDIPDETIQCVVTSPPYYGLRKYSGEQELILGGDSLCEHEWRHYKRPNGGGHPSESAIVGSTKADVQRVFDYKAGFCPKCGAWKGALGLEPSPELYISHLVQIFQEVKRVLRPDGVCWLNLGDSYAGSWGYMSHNLEGKAKRGGTNERPPTSYAHPILKPLDMCMIPSRVALALQADGWYLRSTIIWQKQNPMPESLSGWRWEKHRIKVKSQDYSEYKQLGKLSSGELSGGYRNRDAIGGVWQGGAEWQDCSGCPKCSPNDGYILRKGSWRPTSSYEYIIMLTKIDSYFCDAEAVRVAWKQNEYDIARAIDGSYRYQGKHKDGYAVASSRNDHLNAYATGQPIGDPTAGRNLRNVWTFPTTPFPEAHFAVFPEKLPETCIKAATSQKGCCPKCGSPWVRVIEQTGHINIREPAHVPDNTPTKIDSTGWALTTRATNKWRPSCKCGELQPVPCTVLDPFMGSGTTLKVASYLQRKAIGYDISLSYCEMARDRCKQGVLDLK